MEELNSDPYKDCFFYNELLNCGRHGKSRKDGLFSEQDLAADVRNYLERVNVKAPDRSVSEKKIISSRSGKVLPEGFKLCAKHRFDFGTYWNVPTVCLHPYHKENRKRKVKGLRTASWATYELICKYNSSANFPIGGTVCPKHRDYLLSKDLVHQMNDEVEIADITSSDPTFEVPNSLLVETDKTETNSFIKSSTEGVSPVKFQLKSPVSELSASTIRYMKRKYSEVTNNFKATLTKKMAPEQEYEFRKVVSDSSSCSETEAEDECLKEIVAAFKSTPSQKMKLALLSLLDPQKYTKLEVIEKFQRSQRMVRRARELRAQFGPGNMPPVDKISRNRLDMSKVDHFLDFLFTTDSLQDVAYGTTTLKYGCGLKHVTPHAVLIALKTHIVVDYMEFCKSIEFENLSSSSLIRLLNSFNPSQRKFLSGLDNTTADGLCGFSSLCDIVAKLDLAKTEETRLIENLDLGKRYLKTTYKLHCKTSSVCASHCAQFSLSSPVDENLTVKCDHEHHVICAQCHSLLSSLDEIGSKVKNMKHCAIKGEIDYDFNMASKNVMEYMRHIMRGVQQEKAKTAALEQTDEETAFWLQDWSQKILPQNYREKQQDYFGKRGISMHVDVFVTKFNETVEKITYFTVLENCDQDALSTLCVSKHTLEQFKLDFPHIKKLHVKTDNAGCYSGNICAESRYLMAKQLGVKVLRHDYNEPQRGKDQADRESAIAKMFIRTYLCEGHDVASAQDVYDALIFKGRMKNAKVSIIDINKDQCYVGSLKIPDIQSYHSVKFENNEMIFWKYFEIGTGKKIPYSNLEFNCNFQIIRPFSSKQTIEKHSNKKSMSLSRKFVSFLFCPEDNCTSTFETADELSLHIARGEHTIPKLISGMDKAKNMFAKRMETITKKTDYLITNSFETVTASSSNQMYSYLISQEGWALKPKRKVTRLSQNQKQFLEECFYKGDKTGNKLTAHNVVKMMRGLTADGKKNFCPEEYLTQEQVMSYFSRMKGKTKNLDAEKDDANEEDDESLYATIEDNELTERENIRKETKLFAEKENELHPHSFYAVMFDKRFYFGKLLEDCGSDLFKMKFLHQRGAQEFKWPIRDYIDTVHRSTIFFGPIQLSGADHFTVPCLKDIQESYKEQLCV